MSALPPVTGSSPAKPEQVEALARRLAALAPILARDEQSAMDAAAALAGIPPDNLVRLIHALHLGWEARRSGGRFAVRVERAADPKRRATIEVDAPTPIL